MKTNRHVIYPRTFRIRMCDTITNNIPSRAHILKGIKLMISDFRHRYRYLRAFDDEKVSQSVLRGFNEERGAVRVLGARHNLPPRVLSILQEKRISRDRASPET